MLSLASGLLLLALELPAIGTTARVEGRVGADNQPFKVEIDPPAAETWALIELGGDDLADLDLEVRIPDAVVRSSAGHRSGERLLVSFPPGVSSQVVVLARRLHETACAVAITPLAPAPRIQMGETARGPAAGRAALVPLGGPEGPALVTLTGEGEVDLLIVDPALEPLALCEGSGDERTVLSLQAGCLAVVLFDPAARGFGLTLHPAGDQPLAALDRFVEELGRTPEQRQALTVLRRHPDWVAIRAYLDRYPGGAPLELRTVPGLRARGVERFGGYSQGVLAINPTIGGHRDNVQELVDTLIHELIHALLSLPREPGYPLGADVLDSSHDPELAPIAGRMLRRGTIPERYTTYLEREYGPSASDPERDWSDINSGAQHLVKKVVEANLARTALGRETLVFENIRRRESAGK